MDKNTFAPLPPMGWNSYDYYDTTVNEAQVRANAEAMARSLKRYGWEYVVVDIQWYAHNAGSQRATYQYIPFGSLEMDDCGRLLPDPARFPSSANGAGFKPLADYIHSLGLKFGIHIMRGVPRMAAHLHLPVHGASTTCDRIADPSSVCRWNPDMYGVRNTPDGQKYYDSLLQLYASWGADFIKCDDICNTDNWVKHSDRAYENKHEIEMLHAAIQRCGRPIVLSLSPGPALIEQAWHYKQYANMWRITDDFWDDWHALYNMFYRCELWQDHVEAGCFPDCDMLPLGHLHKGHGRERTTFFTPDEQTTMLTLWCLFSSPLMLGAELTKLDDFTLSLLTNEKLLALRAPAHRPRQLARDDHHAIWRTHNAKTGETHIAFFNLSDSPRTLSHPVDRSTALDLWTSRATMISDHTLSVTLRPHACAIFALL